MKITLKRSIKTTKKPVNKSVKQKPITSSSRTTKTSLKEKNSSANKGGYTIKVLEKKGDYRLLQFPDGDYAVDFDNSSVGGLVGFYNTKAGAERVFNRHTKSTKKKPGSSKTRS